MKKWYKYFFLVAIILMVCFFGFRKKDKIDVILQSDAYSYLPMEAKEYIKENYQKSGKIILTEKNKEKGKPYLNPNYIQYLQLSDEDKTKQEVVPFPTTIDYSSKGEYSNTSYPSSYDLRSVNGKNYVTPVRDQKSLGICWAFASAGAIESYLLKTTNAPYSSSARLISERQLDYATSLNGIKDYDNEYNIFIRRLLGDGSNFYITSMALASGVGAIDYNSFKAYNDHDLSQMELQDILSHNNSLYELNSSTFVPENIYRESTSDLTEEEQENRLDFINRIKDHVMNYGATYVATNMSNFCNFEDANSNLVIDDYSCGNTFSGHAMEIIGWDDNYEYSYCADGSIHETDISSCRNIVSGRGVWILKNSWGQADTPNPYLAYDSASINPAFINSLTPTSEKTWDNNYIYGDGSGRTGEITIPVSELRIHGNEKLDKIKFITDALDGNYTIRVKDAYGNWYEEHEFVELPELITHTFTNNIIINSDSEIKISSEDDFVNKFLIFTNNTDSSPFVDLSAYSGVNVSESTYRFYSNTKNIPSGANIIYKVKKNNVDYSSSIEVTTNKVAENNVNTTIHFIGFADGEYTLQALYNSQVVGSVTFNYHPMQGSGTSSDPFIITNPVQLAQISDNPSAYYELGNDIDMTAATREGGKFFNRTDSCPDDGFGWQGIKNFSGTLDGKGHSIIGLKQKNRVNCGITTTWRNKSNGLFYSAKGDATIKNLVLEDFDVYCQGGFCGLLISVYRAHLNENDFEDGSDSTIYNPTFSNIVVKNAKIHLTQTNNANSSWQHSDGGGLLGDVLNPNGSVNISNIYLDLEVNNPDSYDSGVALTEKNAFLTYVLQAKNSYIDNIQMMGTIYPADNRNNRVLGDRIYKQDDLIINNIFSSVVGKQIDYSFGSIDSNGIIKNVNLLQKSNSQFCLYCNPGNNVNIYDADTEIIELTKPENYSTWDNFDDNWIFRTIDGIPRFPVLKIVNFTYTTINDINIVHELNSPYKSIYDYVMPDIASAKNIIFRSNDESIVKVLDDGSIVPQSSGSTTIHVESYYDGYIKDVPITITYKPHYNLEFVASNGTDNQTDLEVLLNQNYTLSDENIFDAPEGFTFDHWNTEEDGSGEKYRRGDIITSSTDKEVIRLYAQYKGTLVFDAQGGNVSINSKEVFYNRLVGELPLPTKEGAAFEAWEIQTGDKSIRQNVQYNTNTKYITGTLVAEASWLTGAYTLAYNGNGGVLPKDHSYSAYQELKEDLLTRWCSLNSNRQLMSNPFLRDGYVFTGWNTKEDGTGESYTAGDTINFSSVPDSLFTLYAQWKKNSHTITFHKNYGTDELETQEMDDGVSTALRTNTFTRNGFSFKEWNTDPGGNGTSYVDGEEISVSSDLELYAIWEETFDFIINNLNVNETKLIVYKLPVGMVPDEFTSNITLNYGYGTRVDTKNVNNQEVLYTGGKFKITKGLADYKVYTLSVLGDVNGDGKIGIIDYIRIMKHIMGDLVLENEYSLAADMNENSRIDIIDYIRIMKIIMEES